jgi:nucleoside 2-deoxyribosyltransferase
MRVHFVGDLSGNKEDYKKIIKYIEKFGHEVLTDHSVKRSMEELDNESVEEAELYAKKMSNWMKKADIVVVEVTKPLLGAGYEIAIAIQLGKPVVALYRPEGKNTPYVLKGLLSEKLQVVSYNDNTLDEALKEALEYASEQMDTRFNFFVSPSITNYLDWVSQKKRLPRAVYLRKLIESDMNSNKEYMGSDVE